MADAPDAAAKKKAGEGDGPPGKLIAGLVVVVGLVAPLGLALGTLALTGTVGRIQRNAEWQTLGAYGAVVLGSGLWALGSFKWTRLAGLKPAAVLFAVVGTIVALWAAIFTAGRQPRPRIAVSLNQPLTELSVTVSATALKTGDRLAIVVDALKLKDQKDPISGYETVGPSLYQAYVGPDPDGKVTQTASVRIPSTDVTAVGVRATTATEFPDCNDRAENANKTEQTGKAESKEAKKTQDKAGTGCVIMVVR
jgi:hypothetical protein